MSIEEFEKEATKILNRYQSKGGGYLLEDDEWIVHRSDSKYHDVGKNEIAFSNTISEVDIEDFETNKYLDHMRDILNNICENVQVESYQEFNKPSKTITIIFWSKVIQ